MKTLLIALTLAFAATGCSAETAKTPAKQEVKVEEKKTEVAPTEKKEVESKRVCIKVWDASKQKEIEKCKVMKMHEKHEGTKVPTK